MQLQVQYILREKKILVRDFCKLSVGDLIVFPENKKEPISIYIEKKQKFKAKVYSKKNKIYLKIQ